MTKPTSKSEQLITELIEAKIINDKADKTKTLLIVRRYLCDAFSEGVESEKCANNHINYTKPSINNL